MVEFVEFLKILLVLMIFVNCIITTCGIYLFVFGIFHGNSKISRMGLITSIISVLLFLIIKILFYHEKPVYKYEAELKNGSIVEANDCYKKENKSVCTVEGGDKKVVEDYWEIEK